MTQLPALFASLPCQQRELVKEPCFQQIRFDQLSPQNVQKAVRIIKTKTLLSSLQPPRVSLQSNDKFKNQPIIVVFCQPSEQLRIDDGEIYPYTPISYCSWVQSAGAMCVPMPYNLNQGSMQSLLQKSNGLILPGGGSNLYKDFEGKEGCGPVMSGLLKLWRYLTKMWAKGIQYPVWGTCLGLEMSLLALSGDTKILSRLNSRGHQVQIYSEYSSSQIFAQTPVSHRILLENYPLLNFAHSYGISLYKFNNSPKLKQKLKLISVSQDKDKKWFCSYLEGRNIPLFLSQFHPQKQAFQWTLKGDILHSKQSVAISQYLAQRFISIANALHPERNFLPLELEQNSIRQYQQIYHKEKMYKIYVIQYKHRNKEDRKHTVNSKRGISIRKINL